MAFAMNFPGGESPRGFRLDSSLRVFRVTLEFSYDKNGGGECS